MKGFCDDSNNEKKLKLMIKYWWFISHVVTTKRN